MRLGIIGIGVVGGALLAYFNKQGYDVAVYDSKGVGSLQRSSRLITYIYACRHRARLMAVVIRQ